MSRHGEEARGGSMAWGCLIPAILLAVLGAGLAIVFLWDVNAYP